jgi:hypothetical protein
VTITKEQKNKGEELILKNNQINEWTDGRFALPTYAGNYLIFIILRMKKHSFKEI